MDNKGGSFKWSINQTMEEIERRKENRPRAGEDAGAQTYGSLKSQIHLDSAEILELTLLQCSHMLGHYFLGISGRSHCAPLNRVLVLHSRSFYHLATGNQSIWNGYIWSWKKHHKNAFFSCKLSSLYFFFPQFAQITLTNYNKLHSCPSLESDN